MQVHRISSLAGASRNSFSGKRGTVQLSSGIYSVFKQEEQFRGVPFKWQMGGYYLLMQHIYIHTYVSICDKTEYKVTVEGSCNIKFGVSPQSSNTPISKGMIRSPWPRSCSGPDSNSQPAKC